MLLRLTPMEAAMRATFAAASVAVAAVGHALGTEHAHHDLPRTLMAMVLLLGVAWGTRRPSRILIAAIAAQLLVHGGVPATAHMVASHLLATIIALLLMAQGERLWALLGDLCLGRLPADPVALPRPTAASMHCGVRVARSMWLRTTVTLRAPPALA